VFLCGGVEKYNLNRRGGSIKIQHESRRAGFSNSEITETFVKTSLKNLSDALAFFYKNAKVLPPAALRAMSLQ